MLHKIYFHGAAVKQFGKMIELDVASLAEAARAIQVFHRGFRQFLVENNFIIMHGDKKKGWNLGEEHISFNLPAGDIHITPVVQGAAQGKQNGIMKLVAGLVIAAVAWWAAPAVGGLGASVLGGGGILGGFTYGNVVMLGLGLAATGLSQLLTPKQTDTSEKDSSFMLSGQLNQTAQGGPVPLIYGRTDVSSVLISAGVETVDIPIGESGSGSSNGSGWWGKGMNP